MARTSLTPAAEHPVLLEGGGRQRVEHTNSDLCACRCGIQVTLQDTTAVPLALWLLPGAAGAWFGAAVFGAGGLLERWLFFARAEHGVRRYHGQASA
jgi:hypothetical protein